MSGKTIVVFGATGNQGSGVVKALLETTDFLVQAVSSNPNADKAQRLKATYAAQADAGRLKLVQADWNDAATLSAAVQDAHGVFAAMAIDPNEVKQGHSLVDVCAAAGIAHFVYSSLPSLAANSGGKYNKAFVFDNKAEIEAYAKERLKSVTVLLPGGFFSSLSTPLYTRRKEDGTPYFVDAPTKHRVIPWLDDQVDVGRFAAAIFAAGPEKTAGKSYPIAGPPMSADEMAKAYTRYAGESATVQRLEYADALSVLPDFLRPCFEDIYRYLEDCDQTKVAYGTMAPEDDHGYKDLAVRASTFEDYVRRTGFRVPR
ncbi:hypothetical protein JCM10908_005388 [Rhodotorula pacifica]|uniref:uncharacterized protein n=1 Tax=Rhodotorula pacifica TaxID=1495444 RepID=UPI003181FB51